MGRKLIADISPNLDAFGDNRDVRRAVRLLIEEVNRLTEVVAVMPSRCSHCNDEGVVHSHEGAVLGPCDCAALTAEREAGRRLVDDLVDRTLTGLREPLTLRDARALRDEFVLIAKNRAIEHREHRSAAPPTPTRETTDNDAD